MKRKAGENVTVTLGLLLWPAALILLLLIGSRVWAAARQPMLRHWVLTYADDLVLKAEQDLAAADAPFYDRDMSIPEEGDSVWYVSFARGLAPDSIEYGYCYIADGTARPYPGMEGYERSAERSGTRWQEPGGDNGCYLRRITENLYYYEVWF